MKKGEIKRRKRVVPAVADQAQATMSTSPDPQSSSLQEDDDHASSDDQTQGHDRPRQHFPPAVDFTGSFASRPRHHDEETHSRKRSFSMSERDGGPPDSTNQSLDPALAALSAAAAVESSEQHDRADRRARLEREAENLRQMLLAKEKELAAIDGAG